MLKSYALIASAQNVGGHFETFSEREKNLSRETDRCVGEVKENKGIKIYLQTLVTTNNLSLEETHCLPPLLGSLSFSSLHIFRPPLYHHNISLRNSTSFVRAKWLGSLLMASLFFINKEQ